MNSLAQTAYAQASYSEVSSPTKLIQMLYDGILRFIFRSKKAIELGDIEQKVLYINKASAIFCELINSLDYSQGDIAHYLHGIYARQIQLLTKANINNSVEPLNEISNVIKQLSEAWKQATENE